MDVTCLNQPTERRAIFCAIDPSSPQPATRSRSTAQGLQPSPPAPVPPRHLRQVGAQASRSRGRCEPWRWPTTAGVDRARRPSSRVSAPDRNPSGAALTPRGRERSLLGSGMLAKFAPAAVADACEHFAPLPCAIGMRRRLRLAALTSGGWPGPRRPPGSADSERERSLGSLWPVPRKVHPIKLHWRCDDVGNR